MTNDTFGSEPYLIQIGDHVTITSGVQFITHDGGVWIFRKQYPNIDVFGPILLGNNIFVGFGAILLPGTTVSDNCIIGAGSIVKGTIPPNVVAAGIPARAIKTTDQYWDSICARATHIRCLSSEEKMAWLLNRFDLMQDGVMQEDADQFRSALR